MIRTLLKMAAYRKAPKTTFALSHPKQALRLALLRKELRVSPLPKAAAIGAAAVALPLGIALGRLTRRDRMAYEA